MSRKALRTLFASLLIAGMAAGCGGSSQPQNTAVPSATATPTIDQTATFNANAAATLAVIHVTQTAHAVPTNTQAPLPTLTPNPPAIISVTNKGGFVARFTVTYNDGGQQTLSSGDIPIPQTKSETIPGTATDISVTVEEFTGFSWTNPDGCKFHYSSAANQSYTISGTTFNASCQ